MQMENGKSAANTGGDFGIIAEAAPAPKETFVRSWPLPKATLPLWRMKVVS